MFVTLTHARTRVRLVVEFPTIAWAVYAINSCGPDWLGVIGKDA